MFEVEYDLAEEDLIHFNEKRFLNTEQSRKRLRFGQGIVPAILVMIGLFYGLLLRDEYTGLFTVVFALVLAFGTPYFSRWE
ncbi:MAG: YcxB family protein, partial [Methylococcales bacterium]|nr:YcxB family protein [Methylococcales bacterium]